MTTAPPALHRRRWIWFAAGAAIAIIGIAADVWLWMQRLPPVQAVAIAPLIDMTPAKDQARFCEGLGVEIRDTLARAQGVQVTISTAAKAAPGAAVLDAMLQRSESRLTLIAQLTRSSDGHRYWSKTFSRPVREASFLPLDVARAIARIPEERRTSKASRENPNLEAYELYLTGRSRFEQHLWEDAAGDFDRATQADPNFAAAWAWLAIALTYRVEAEPLRPNAVMPQAREAAERAAALDPGSAISHLALGIIRLQYDWEWDAAREELDRALQLAPGSSLARNWRDRWDAATHRASAAGAPAEPYAAESPLYQAAWQAASEGNPGPARKFLEDAQDIRVEIYIPPVAIALLALKVNDLDNLFVWLNEAYDERCPALPYAYLAPGFPGSDPRYLDLLARMRIPSPKPVPE